MSCKTSRARSSHSQTTASLKSPSLKLLRVGVGVADTLQCSHLIWNPGARHVIDSSILLNLSLPSNFHPVGAQFTVSHHPLLDILPWPSVREKLIRAFAAPEHLRPPVARDALAIPQMMYDMDDASEGFRIHGPNGAKEEDWEVGQRYFINWWWALN